MSSYKVKDGFDQALVDLVTITPQPRSEGVLRVRRTYAAGGAVIEEGRYIELVWDLVGDIAAFQSLLNQFGLGSALTNEVTLYAPEQYYAYNRFNGVAVRPELGRDVSRNDFFVRNITILFRDLTYAA